MTLLFHAFKAYVDLPRKIRFILLLMMRETTGCDQGKGIAPLSNTPLARQFSLEARKINGLLIWWHFGKHRRASSYGVKYLAAAATGDAVDVGESGRAVLR
jgi:hypothetical protein